MPPTVGDVVRPTGIAAAATLAGIAGLHVAWGLGSSFPFSRREDLADAVVGAPQVPSPASCYAVAVALTAASALAADLPVASRPLRRLGRAGVAAVLGARGVIGVAGRTDLAVPGSTSPRFRRNDRRYFAPLCLVVAAATATAVPARERRGPS